MKFFFHTFGCRVNQYDTERLRESLTAAPGHGTADDFESADVCVVNTCTVTEEADKDAYKLLRQISRRNPAARLVVTGCLASRDPERLRQDFPAALVIGNDGKEELPALLGCSPVPPGFGIANFHGHSRAFVKVQDGCNMHCTYCIIPSVRPTLISKPYAEVEAEVKGLIAAGYQEIVLCGVRLGRYLVWADDHGHGESNRGERGERGDGGRNGNLELPATSNAGELETLRFSPRSPRFNPRRAGDGDRRIDLLGLIERLADLPGDFRLRLSSLEITDLTDRLIRFAETSGGRLCPSFHLPLQSGSETVLKRMERWYSAAFYRRRVEALRARLPDAGLFTDVMHAFPGETEAEFKETVDFLAALDFSGLHVFRYSRREGTPAATAAEQIPDNVKRERAEALHGLDRKMREAFARKAIGTRRRVLIEQPGEGLTDHFLKVRLDGKAKGMVWVDITGANGPTATGNLTAESAENAETAGVA